MFAKPTTVIAGLDPAIHRAKDCLDGCPGPADEFGRRYFFSFSFSAAELMQ